MLLVVKETLMGTHIITAIPYPLTFHNVVECVVHVINT